ncbi:unnamed protein product [Ranitomeya imitator]|uniref:Uncharacterized protein n=1 Tax=Ranitomeya imitator TaxID=111125 RepID=A0ABN9LZ29_9NEOB|nr:unnamed protein product [Ranitomeya imitator]
MDRVATVTSPCVHRTRYRVPHGPGGGIISVPGQGGNWRILWEALGSRDLTFNGTSWKGSRTSTGTRELSIASESAGPPSSMPGTLDCGQQPTVNQPVKQGSIALKILATGLLLFPLLMD